MHYSCRPGEQLRYAVSVTVAVQFEEMALVSVQRCIVEAVPVLVPHWPHRSGTTMFQMLSAYPCSSS